MSITESFGLSSRRVLHCAHGVLIGVTIALTGPAAARSGSEDLAQPPDLQPLPNAPQAPDQVRSGETLSPDVRIFRRGKDTVTEYRVHGRLRAIKVQPNVGPAYYLYDVDGDGRLDRRSDRFDPDLLVPHWVIFRW